MAVSLCTLAVRRVVRAEILRVRMALRLNSRVKYNLSIRSDYSE